MPLDHIMIDIETSGKTVHSAGILTIGAVRFNPEGLLPAFSAEDWQTLVDFRALPSPDNREPHQGRILGDQGLEAFYIRLKPADDFFHCFQHANSDQETLKWWQGQPPEVIAEAWGQGADRVNSTEALRQLREFIGLGKSYIWAHGGSFDLPILTNAYAVLGQLAPWHFYNERCTRSLFGQWGVKPARREGEHHNALFDAIEQAKAVQECYRRKANLSPFTDGVSNEQITSWAQLAGALAAAHPDHSEKLLAIKTRFEQELN